MLRETKHKECPHCHKFNTKRHSILVVKRVTLEGVEPQGVQRWYCKDCKRAFMPFRPQFETSKYTLEVYEKAVMLYFDQGASFRSVARDLNRMGMNHIAAKRCWAMVQEIGSRCKAPWEVSLALKPHWSGYITVDGDSLKVGSHRESMLLGVDIETLDIPHLILAEHEDQENWLYFFLVLKYILGYPFKGIVSDGASEIDNAVKLVCPGIAHQLCVKHFQDGLRRYLRYQSSHGRGTWREIDRFEETVHRCLYAKTLEQSKAYLLSIQTDAGFHKIHLEDAIGLLEHSFDKLTRHFLYPGLPRTSNVAEGTINKLDRRLTPMDSFSTHQTAWNVLKLLAGHTRFRVLTDCRPPHAQRNGFAPLQLAGVDTHLLNWIRFSQKPERL